MIPLVPPAPFASLGPFQAYPSGYAGCTQTVNTRTGLACTSCTTCEPCRGPSFVLRTAPIPVPEHDLCCAPQRSACSGSQVVCAVPTRLVGRPGWRVLQRYDHHKDVTVVVVQVLAGVTSAAVTLTPAAPYARVYLDLTRGYSVYAFVGLDPTVFSGLTCPCPSQTATLLDTGGCDSMLPVAALPCPSDNVGTACPVPCVGALISAVTIDTEGGLLTIQISLVNPVFVASSNAPVIVRITRRVNGDAPCEDALVPDLAYLDFRLAFTSSTPGFVYLLLTKSLTTGEVTASATYMFSGAPAPGVVQALVLNGEFPVSDTVPNCSLVMYSLCNDYTSVGATPASTTIISQVIWYNSDTLVPCAPECAPSSCILRLPSPYVGVPGATLPPLATDCNTFCINPDIGTITVASADALILLLTTAATYLCGPVEPAPTPPVVLEPEPYIGSLPLVAAAAAAAASSAAAAAAAAAALPLPPRILTWKAPGSFDLHVPEGLPVNAWVTVNGLRFRNSGQRPVAGPLVISWCREDGLAPLFDGTIAVEGSVPRAADTLPPQLLVYASGSGSEEDAAMESLVSGVVCGPENIPMWVASHTHALEILPSDAVEWTEYVSRVVA